MSLTIIENLVTRKLRHSLQENDVDRASVYVGVVSLLKRGVHIALFRLPQDERRSGARYAVGCHTAHASFASHDTKDVSDYHPRTCRLVCKLDS